MWSSVIPREADFNAVFVFVAVISPLLWWYLKQKKKRALYGEEMKFIFHSTIQSLRIKTKLSCLEYSAKVLMTKLGYCLCWVNLKNQSGLGKNSETFSLAARANYIILYSHCATNYRPGPSREVLKYNHHRPAELQPSKNQTKFLFKVLSKSRRTHTQ